MVGRGVVAGRAARAALMGRSTSSLRALAGLLTFTAVLLTVSLPQPVEFPVWPVVVLTVAAAITLPLVRGRLDERWQTLGPLLALGYVLGVVLLTGAGASIYHDLMLVAVAVSALTRSRPATVLVTALGIAVVTVPGLLSGAGPAFFTDALVDGVVVATIALLMHQQSSALRDQSAVLEARAEEAQRHLDREHDVVRKLEQLEVARRTFARNVSHEVRTPLTVLSGTIGVLRHALPEDHQGRQLTDAMDRQCRRLLDMVETIDAVFDNAPMLRERPAARLDQLVAHAVARCPIASDAVEIHRDGELEGAVRVFVDDQLLVDALVHLLTNCMVHGGDDVRVRVEFRAIGDALHVRVLDDGPGWDRDDPAELLRPFEQGEQASTSPTPGVGLGLSLAAAAAGNHGGHVELGRSPMGGAAVDIVIPDAIHHLGRHAPDVIDLTDPSLVE